MSHNSCISGMGEPVPAIRVINEKQMLLITVGINIMLSCGKEYVKLAWEFICREVDIGTSRDELWDKIRSFLG